MLNEVNPPAGGEVAPKPPEKEVAGGEVVGAATDVEDEAPGAAQGSSSALSVPPHAEVEL